ncbi:DNA methyltransferase [Skermanella stibiiresistens SB22]|uniref:DNA methyltransferase n=1 Tax=Skermanella stibiiresistens SB22 TaxID=1385369 RepID=W9GSJ1_9PROT|nr:16S rRNA (guanine(966)-N(2))-methyltransferase RsmD [Skermanella stibiiresistens]EWY36865.1 DNA methyltransferase [Skermanella stibiiresistens SB22]
MRLVGGNLRGRRLEAPAGRDIRPTSDRTREAIFNILAHADWAPEIEGAVVLDAFCGTGALGLEALSRGAKRAVFLDNGRESLDLVRRNVAALSVAGHCDIIRADATRPPRAQVACAFLFLDPPYAKGLAPTALTALRDRGWCAPDAVAVVEIGLEDPWEAPAFAEPLDDRAYGDTRVLFLRVG